ncbi:serine/threonine protein kinase [Streptomyces sp. ME19-01-6]|uniref:serine/threonine protein kinase n=1 Tax=Streptomyces sp. ME19-01-6 TaxID=3028686 RepID=UPI0029B39891|nr:serine/threonine protein kinase [Streptomyces sp. ME19-01-6]MDX3233438.1 serine/threonine protein kinase [Streptomyces sp. ME19-01-6]
MEPLRSDDPRRIGPYGVVARFDADGGRVPVPERRFIARLPGGNRTVVISMPLPGVDAGRFAAEAAAARQGLPGPWIAPVVEIGGTAGAPWYAVPYLPALPLTAGVAAHHGPLPERTVRALGAALAEALAALHASGVTHGGLSPATVLLTTDGPRLTCFGAVRAAAPDGEQRSGLPGLASGSLPPEQIAGGRPRPLGDIYALGSVLAYAATGHLVPERRELPEELRRTIALCLTRDAASRPQAAQLLNELMPTERTAGSAHGPHTHHMAASHGTVLDGGMSRAAAALGPGWLPGRLIAALARQSADLLATETMTPSPYGPVAGLDANSMVSQVLAPQPYSSAALGPASPPPPSPGFPASPAS